ncbi:WD40-repeat-containing domain protein, partial [Zopfochytrium polystomum]
MDIERDRLLKEFLPGTRQWLVDKVLEFLSPPSTAAFGESVQQGPTLPTVGTAKSTSRPGTSYSHRVMWLCGAAGVGKSVMAAVIANELQALSLLGGQFFCKHDDERRSSARNLIVTLAFGLAQFSVHYGNVLLAVYKNTPDVLSRPLPELFSTLIASPLKYISDANKLQRPVVLVVDALDECETLHQRNEILQIFKQLDNSLPAQVKLLVTARPEDDIKRALEELSTIKIEPNQKQNHADQIVFAQKFLEAHGANADLVINGAKLLVSKSGGIFVWLIAACKLLEREASITMAEIRNLPSDLLGSMDLMYARVFGQLFDSDGPKETLVHVLFTIALLKKPLTASGMVALLAEDNPDDVMRAIRMLEPILVLDNGTNKLRLFHKSVKDYLVDPTRYADSRLQVDIFKAHGDIARWCVMALCENLTFNMCNLPYKAAHDEVPDFKNFVRRRISEHVRYAVQHFWEHCQDAASGTSAELRSSLMTALERQLHTLFSTKLHHLLEAMSLLQILPLAMPAMSALQNATSDFEILIDRGSVYLHVLLQDVVRVIQKFLIPLQESALQVYFTAVPFSPTTSGFYRLYAKSLPADVPVPRVLKGGWTTWPGCINVLEGHTDEVNCVVFSPDGQQIVSASRDRTVRIWDARTGQELHKLQKHTLAVTSVACSANFELVASGSQDCTVRVWSTALGAELLTLEGHDGPVWAVAFTPDRAARVVSASADKSVKIWDLATRSVVRTLLGHTDEVLAVAVSPDAALIASGGEDKTVRVWVAATGDLLAALDGHAGSVNAVGFSPDREVLLSGSDDGSLGMWELISGGGSFARMHRLEIHYAVLSAAFSPDGQYVVAGSFDKTVRIRSAANGTELRRLAGHTAQVRSVAVSPNGRFVASGSADRTIRIWDAGGAAGATGGGGGMASSAAARAAWPGAAAAVERAAERAAAQRGHATRVLAVAASADGRSVASGSADGAVVIWNASTGGERARPADTHRGWVNSVEFSADARLLVTGGDDRTVRVFDAASGAVLRTLVGHGHPIRAAAFSRDSARVLSCGDGAVLRVWDVETAAEVQRLEARGRKYYRSAAFSPDGARVVTGQYDGSVGVWDVAAARLGFVLRGHAYTVTAVAFSPDGRRVVSASEDKTVRVWD